ncbi:MAG TPA: hypothetical protein VJ901_01045 [Thermoanaerobaculia bacterium]|nr:hypothetical protein [Thermoanaerobaculia bacterium]
MQTILALADALIDRGHDVRIVTTADGPVTWRASNASWELVDTLDGIDAQIDAAFPWQEFLVIDDAMFRARTPREHEPLRVLLDGIGVPTGYGAAAHARWFHQQFDLIRCAPYAPTRDEPLDSVQEFHVALTTPEMTRLIHSCDVLLAPEHGLRSAEARAAGVPVASVADADNAVELGERLIEILSSEELRDQLRAQGRIDAEMDRAEGVAKRLEAFLKPAL